MDIRNVNTILCGGLLRSLLLAGLGLTAMASHAATLSIQPYNVFSVPGLDLRFEVETDGSLATFQFFNESTDAAAESALARIYFERGLADVGLSGGAVSSEDGVSFSTRYPGPSNPPAGSAINWAGNFFAVGAAASPSRNGLRVGDTLTITFDYTGSTSDLVAALIDMDGNARIAGHILDCNYGNSCAGVSVVPVPAALPLMLGALATLGVARRRRATS